MAFEYKPFINPYIGSISELMGKGDQAKAAALIRIGEIQARAAEQQGQAWGNAIQGLGNIASKTITDYNSPEAQDRRAAEKAKAIFNEMGKAETQTTQGLAYRNVAGGAGAVPAELTRSELSFDSLGNPKVGADGKYVRTEVPGAAAIPGTLPSRQGFPTITRTNPYRVLAESGVKNLDKWDIDAASKNFAENNVPPELAFKYTQIMRTSNADMEEHHEKAMSIMRKNASDILQFSPDARLGAAQQLLEKYQNNGVLSYKDLQNARQQLESIAALPAGEQAVATSKFLYGLSGERPQFVSKKSDEEIVNPLTSEVVLAAKSTAPEGFTLAKDASRYDSNGNLLVSNAGQPPGKKLTGATFEMRDSTTGKSGMYQRYDDGSFERIGDVIPPVVAGKEVQRVDIFDPQSENVANVVVGSQQHNDLLKNGGVPVGSLTGVTASIAANRVSENSRKSAYDYSNDLIREIDLLLVKELKPASKPGQPGQPVVDDPDTYRLTNGAKDNYGFGSLLVPGLRGSEKANALVQLNKIRSGTLLATLTKLKESSANGSTGFGALNIAELTELQNSSNTLQNSQDAESALRELVRMRNSAMKIKQGYESDPPKQRTGSGRPTGSPAPGKFRIDEELPNLGDTVHLPPR